MTVKRWPMRLPNNDRILDVIGTTYDIAARRFKRAFGVEPIGECWKEREMSYLLVDCLDCGEEGIIYCRVCERPCEHDRMCRKCRGRGMAIEEEKGFLASMLVAEGIAYRTRAEARRAQASIE